MTPDPALEAALENCRTAMGAGVGIISTDGVFLDADPQLCALLGRTREQLVGLDKDAVLTTADRQFAQARARLRRQSHAV